MHKFLRKTEKDKSGSGRQAISEAARFLQQHGGGILYYGGLGLALCLFAYSAQNLRMGRVENRNEGSQVTEMETAVQLEAETQAEMLSFSWPEDGIILREFSRTPVWNGALGCWQCHMGVDMSREDGIAMSISDGTVCALGEKGSDGGYVEVQTGETILRYASIEPLETMKVGAEISAGEPIGRMNTSMPDESWMDRHVHIEMKRQDEYFNPLTEGE